MVRYAALKNLYETEKTIGSGGFAKVKLARHLLTGEKVAIKIMDKECLGDDLPRVKMEVEALKGLTHHHICRLYQVIETDTHFFLVMEYCAGGELFDHIVQCNRLSEMDSRSFFRQILSAVAYLHSKGFVHRDIKPENVLLDRDECAKLIDFGLCAKPSLGLETQLDTACGSPTYAAPELIKGDKYLGAAADVWSMGVVLYALLCGCLPFESDQIDALYKKIVSGAYSEPDHLSQSSRQILRAMLETDPSRRVTVDQLLSHPWLQLGYNEPVSFKSLYKEVELDQNCVNTMASHFRMTGEDVWKRLNEKRFDHFAATYLLLLSRKKQGLPLQLGEFVLHTPRARLHSMRRAVMKGGSSHAKGTYAVLPNTENKEKENTRMQPPDNTNTRTMRKRQRSMSREPSASPVPRKVAATTDANGSSTKAKMPIKSSGRVPSTPTQPALSPSSRLLNSIERKMQHVRKVLTPKRKSRSETPALLTAKNMSNISTTSSNCPDHVRAELVKALNSQGIECNCKGYSVRGKLETADGKVCKLSFELEVCLIPTTTSANGSVVGIRRKRLKGDAWCYKRVCEEVLNMADLK